MITMPVSLASVTTLTPRIQKKMMQTIVWKTVYIKPFSGKRLKICHVNINSLPAKIDDLKYTLKYNPFDIKAITETHCDKTVPDSKLLYNR